MKDKGSATQMDALDPTTPWFEFLSYCEACRSLNAKPSVGRFIKYQTYLKSVKFDKTNIKLTSNHAAD